MKHFKKKFIEDIISADESNVETIINRRMTQLTENNVNNDLLHLFLTTMIFAFTDLIERESLNTRIRKNMTIAIKVFKNMEHELTSKEGK